MRYHLTTIRMTVIKKTENTKCWWAYGEIGPFVQGWWDCKMVQPLQKTVWRFLQKVKNRNSIRVLLEVTIPLLGTHPKEWKWKHLYSSIIHNRQEMKATKISIDGWMDKQNATDTCNGILLSLKKEKSVTSYKMDEPWGHYAKRIRQSQKVRYYWL